jgi:hypothetical protein
MPSARPADVTPAASRDEPPARARAAVQRSLTTARRIARARGYITPADFAAVDAALDKVRAMLWRLTHGAHRIPPAPTPGGGRLRPRLGAARWSSTAPMSSRARWVVHATRGDRYRSPAQARAVDDRDPDGHPCSPGRLERSRHRGGSRTGRAPGGE